VGYKPTSRVHLQTEYAPPTAIHHPLTRPITKGALRPFCIIKKSFFSEASEELRDVHAVGQGQCGAAVEGSVRLGRRWCALRPCRFTVAGGRGVLAQGRRRAEGEVRGEAVGLERRLPDLQQPVF
jgi:hypothetical protein